MKHDILEQFSLKNKVAVISGTTRGIGQALAESLLEAGATVISLDKSDNDHLKQFSTAYDERYERVIVDLLRTAYGELEALVSSIVRKYGKIDILVNNAGITRRGEVHEFKDQDWNDVIHVNLSVPFYLSKIVSKHLISRKSGKIINIASMLSFQGGLRVPSYTSSKHGIVGLTKSFSNGLAKYGINVNAIAPGFIKTELTKPLQEDPDRNRSIMLRIPAERWGESDDIKGALIFLSSAMSNYIHGAVIPVDGGWLSS